MSCRFWLIAVRYFRTYRRMMSPTEEIKAKVDIVDLVGEYVKLTPAGLNHKARCPFHAEKTPSFMVSRDKGIWHCFGCSEGGDIFSFIQKAEGLDFPEALALLARRAGVVLRRDDPAIASQRTRLIELCELTTRFWQRVLQDSPSADAARQYVHGRTLTDDTVEQWQLGYAPDQWSATLDFLVKKGFNPEELFTAGLVIRREQGNGFYDRFRGRLMFPIRDHHGHVVGFSGRLLAADAKEVKYVNTPQTPLFNKGHLLFGLDKAKNTIRHSKRAVLVEGNVDVVMSHQAGVTEAVATCGTALTADHLQLLKRYTDTLVLSFDQDSAGHTAAERAIALALQAGLNTRIVLLPAGEDPDSFIRHSGAEAWRAAVDSAVSVLEYAFQHHLTGANLQDATVKRTVAAKLLTAISNISNPIEQTHWLGRLADTLNVPESILRETLRTLVSRSTGRGAGMATEPTAARPPEQSRAERQSERIIGFLLQWPSRLPTVIEQLPAEALAGELPGRLYTELVAYYTMNRDSTATGEVSWTNTFVQTLPPPLAEYAERVQLSISRDDYGVAPESVSTELAASIADVRRQFLAHQLQTVSEQLRVAEQRGDTTAVRALAEQFSHLTSQLATFNT